tara:strand:- start:1199 stop:2035 length:837 start_codon:yes stop_codon:yes gene_type:complete
MSKKGKRGFKMKGFCPKSSSPMRKLGDLKKSDGSDKSARRIAAENRLLQLTDIFRKPKNRRGTPQSPRAQERRRRAIAKQNENEEEARLSHPQKPIGSVDPAAPVAPRPFPTTYEPLSIQEQKLIAQSISKMGGFGTVHPMLVKGYGDLSSPAGRKRMQKLNAYHFYMTTRADTPEQAAKNRENLHQTLSRMEDKRRTSNFLGARNRSYDKYGRPIAELQEKYRKQVRDSIGVDPKTGRLIVSKVPLTEKQRMERDYPELTEQVRRRRRRRRRNGRRI